LWFINNKERIRGSFSGKYVAILGERVIDNDSDKFLLIQRLWSMGIFPGPVLIERVD
jgi:hypothetical protein